MEIFLTMVFALPYWYFVSLSWEKEDPEEVRWWKSAYRKVLIGAIIFVVIKLNFFMPQ